METKILVLSVSAWSSKSGMNTWPALLEGRSPDCVANICLRGETPDSNICNNYFYLSENKVLKSIFKRGIKTGEIVNFHRIDEKRSIDLAEHNERYSRMKKRRSAFYLMAREIVWLFGKWRSRELKDFIMEFAPDVILYSMDGYIHFNRLCRYAKKLSGAKSVGFFVDDNFSYKQSKKIGDRLFRVFQRASLKKIVKKTDAFWAITDMTKKEADRTFDINCTVLTKPMRAIPDEICFRKTTKPIKILYTGNLLIGRDRSLLRVVNAIKEHFSKDFVIDVYTQTELSDDKRREIEVGGVCRIHAPIPQNEVLEKQKEADLLLFLEDIDGPDAHTARLSFSTKITDYLSSGKAMFAVGCKETAPMQYFIDNNAAFVASSDEEIKQSLSKISDSPDLLVEYATRARDTGIKNHSKEKVLAIFNDTISEVLKNKDM